MAAVAAEITAQLTLVKTVILAAAVVAATQVVPMVGV
jgi:hypothetical protein